MSNKRIELEEELEKIRIQIYNNNKISKLKTSKNKILSLHEKYQEQKSYVNKYRGKYSNNPVIEKYDNCLSLVDYKIDSYKSKNISIIALFISIIALIGSIIIGILQIYNN